MCLRSADSCLRAACGSSSRGEGLPGSDCVSKEGLRVKVKAAAPVGDDADDCFESSIRTVPGALMDSATSWKPRLFILPHAHDQARTTGPHPPWLPPAPPPTAGDAVGREGPPSTGKKLLCLAGGL